ncbi:hypothetical protein NM688_g7254 [Phlebia brevispora]|uniref:Uncharacterized protein n=1 Tax=Phlebia brevispora TaxID=194682 RepID=A0ACC1S7E8_9APHY|nr:hypothetical protein NM688_g7254 [Phlebia brevispora]
MSSKNVPYVPGSGPTGWAGIAKTIRDVDEDKILDYKEDIDTLLVFTGLFSAVLTAFVVESYQSLSPDPMAPVVILLGRIANQTQSYTVTAGAINSTFSPAPATQCAFEPSLAAVRTNQLWFASLMITLITASFAMLVKQWLRQYLAMEYTSPYERLRARQYRHPGLAAWKVFEIAGLLPLLLQLALGLFFLGMCFFTWSVNTGVGKSSTALVSGWIFSVISVTLAPLVSPRCPYKTSLLGGVMVKGRQGVRWILSCLRSQRDLGDLPFVPRAIIRASLPAATAVAPAVPTDSVVRSFLSQSDIEEHEALRQSADELKMLQEVDAFLLDDDLLGTTIFDSLIQYHTDPSAIIRFVLQAINLRVPETVLTQPLSSSPDLSHLTKRGWIAITDIVANTILHTFAERGTRVGAWFEDTVYLLFSQSNEQLSPTANKALTRCMQEITLSRFVKVLTSLASTPMLARRRLYEILEPISNNLVEAVRKSDIPPSDIITLVIQLYKPEANIGDVSLPLRRTFDLQSLQESLWTFGSNMVAAAVLYQLDADRANSNVVRGTWFEDALYLLLSSNLPLTAHTLEALAFGIQKSTISRLTILLGSLTPVSGGCCPGLTCSELVPEDVVHLVRILYELDGGIPPLARPYPRVIDLQALSQPIWAFGSHMLGETILHALNKEEDGGGIGYWLEDAIIMLLATSPCPLHATAINTLAALCKENAPRRRFYQCIRAAASPESSQYPHAIAIFRDVCKQLSTPDDMCHFLGNLLLSIPCSSKCTHPKPSPLALLFHDHIQEHEDWARHYVPLLVDRITVMIARDDWPPGAPEGFRALLSCPVPLHRLHADAPGILWDVIATFDTSDSALDDLVRGTDEERHSYVKMDVAIENVVSLFADVDSEGTKNVHFSGGVLKLIALNAQIAIIFWS